MINDIMVCVCVCVIVMNYGVEEENQVEVLGYMLPVFSLVDGMRGYHKIVRKTLLHCVGQVVFQA